MNEKMSDPDYEDSAGNRSARTIGHSERTNKQKWKRVAKHLGSWLKVCSDSDDDECESRTTSSEILSEKLLSTPDSESTLEQTDGSVPALTPESTNFVECSKPRKKPTQRRSSIKNDPRTPFITKKLFCPTNNRTGPFAMRRAKSVSDSTRIELKPVIARNVSLPDMNKD